MSHPALASLTRELIAEITLRHMVQPLDDDDRFALGGHHWAQIKRVIGWPDHGSLPAWYFAPCPSVVPAPAAPDGAGERE